MDWLTYEMTIRQLTDIVIKKPRLARSAWKKDPSLVFRLRQKETELKQRSDGLENLLRRTEMKIQMPLNVFLMGQPGEEEKQRAACGGGGSGGSGGGVGRTRVCIRVWGEVV